MSHTCTCEAKADIYLPVPATVSKVEAMTKQLTPGDIRINAEPIASQDWNSAISALPDAHILQTWQWGQVKSQYGWQPHPRLWQDREGNTLATAMVLERTLNFPAMPIKARMLYIPKGPLLAWEQPVVRRAVLADLARLARRRKAIFVKIDPDGYR